VCLEDCYEQFRLLENERKKVIFSLLSTRSSLTLDDKTYEYADIMILFDMPEALFTADSHIVFHTIDC